ncbi:acyl-CoA reductase [Ramlibacter sp. AW1]|uniref:Acyl-CoA reductase n=1 Tax=Ramlibacter aurantiacus TaxID=2801330 RepID=A0A936ZSZ2_9BURK|nr:acyl-CoA reductase [Ramlibacter aurantiacus]MBL0421991.1 acyl-CoA reductase [Ramlibacter aurantiacus]
MTTRWVAGHLPPAFAREARWHTLAFGDLQVEVPRLDAPAMRELARHVAAAGREHLKPLAVSTVIGHVDRAVARLLDPQDPYRREADALLPRVTGLDAGMVSLALTGYLKTFRAPQLHRFVAEDFANPKVLDEFQPAVKGGLVRALGPRLLAHSWAGNVPGLPLWSLACGLLVKAPAIGKLPSAEPVFASLFARLLAEVHPPWAGCLAVLWWPGGEPEPAATLYAEADTVLAYGGTETMRQLRVQVPPHTRLLAFGHKLALGLVGRQALDAQRGPATARLAAHDVARYEQQGCYSPHVFYVERGGRLAPREFAQHLAGELANLQQRYPRRTLALEEAAAVARWRDAGQAGLGEGDAWIADERGAWAVSYADSFRPLAPTAGQRCVQVVAVESLDQAVDALAPHAPFLQTVGVAVEPAALLPLSERLAAAGATRICALGGMTAPEAGWHHDGRFNLLDLVRMVEIEQGAERSAERYAPYAQEET